MDLTNHTAKPHWQTPTGFEPVSPPERATDLSTHPPSPLGLPEQVIADLRRVFLGELSMRSEQAAMFRLRMPIRAA